MTRAPRRCTRLNSRLPPPVSFPRPLSRGPCHVWPAFLFVLSGQNDWSGRPFRAWPEATGPSHARWCVCVPLVTTLTSSNLHSVALTPLSAREVFRGVILCGKEPVTVTFSVALGRAKKPLRVFPKGLSSSEGEARRPMAAPRLPPCRRGPHTLRWRLPGFSRWLHSCCVGISSHGGRVLGSELWPGPLRVASAPPASAVTSSVESARAGPRPGRAGHMATCHFP